MPSCNLRLRTAEIRGEYDAWRKTVNCFAFRYFVFLFAFFDRHRRLHAYGVITCIGQIPSPAKYEVGKLGYSGWPFRQLRRVHISRKSCMHVCRFS
jgi:hypothetical protein